MSFEFEIRLDKIREEFDQLYEKALDEIAIDGKRIGDAMKEQIVLCMLWETFLRKIEHFCSVLEYHATEAYSAAVSKELQDGYKKTSISEAKEFARADKTYKYYSAVLLEAQRIKGEAKAVVETITSRKFILHNMSNLIIADQENHIL